MKELTGILSEKWSSNRMIHNSWAMKFDVSSLKDFTSFDLNPGSGKLTTGMATEVTSTTGIPKKQ